MSAVLEIAYYPRAIFIGILFKNDSYLSHTSKQKMDSKCLDIYVQCTEFCGNVRECIDECAMEVASHRFCSDRALENHNTSSEGERDNHFFIANVFIFCLMLFGYFVARIAETRNRDRMQSEFHSNIHDFEAVLLIIYEPIITESSSSKNR